LYYNTFKGKLNAENIQYKWLNLEKLIPWIVSKKYKKNTFVKTKYYTAHVSGKEDPGKLERQNVYLNTLKSYCEQTEIYYGKYIVKESYRTKVNKVFPFPSKVKVFLPEEKGSDVNLASHMLFDAFRNKFEVAVLVSNDSDLEEPLRIITEEFDKKVIIVQPKHVNTSKSLLKYSFDVLRFDKSDLKECQLPLDIPYTKYHKPNEWK
jgi:uncharacterized LabA/DUF88 family protein